MLLLRIPSLNRAIAVLALLITLLHVGVFPQHALMRIAASAQLIEAGKSVIDNSGPICHAGVIDERAKKRHPGKLKVTFCVTCASALAFAAAPHILPLAEYAPLVTAQVYATLDAGRAHAGSLSAFEARGPPIIA